MSLPKITLKINVKDPGFKFIRKLEEKFNDRELKN